MTFEKE